MSNKEDYNDDNEYKFGNIEDDRDTHKKVKKKGGAGAKIYSVLITLLAGALAGTTFFYYRKSNDEKKEVPKERTWSSA